MSDLTPLRWRRDPLGGLYTADEGWTIERITHEGMRGGRITSWQVRRYSLIVADTYGLNAAKQWVQVERAGGHR